MMYIYMYIIIRCSRETRLSEHVRDFSTIYVDTPISWYRAFNNPVFLLFDSRRNYHRKIVSLTVWGNTKTNIWKCNIRHISIFSTE